ncbi:unnamed protein product [Rhodiola kirilowii]
MGSVVDPALPVIDLSNETLNLGSPAWPSTCHQVRIALEEYGCFIAMYHQEPLEHLTFFQGLKDLFDRPIHTKSQNISILPYHGYIGMQSILGLHESMGIERATTLDGVQKFTNLMFPAGNDSFSQAINVYSNQMAELDRLVIKMVCESYGVESYYASHVEMTDYLLRVMKYNGLGSSEPKTGLLPHTDKSFTTILHQNQVKGLEVKTKKGDWICYNPLPCSFLILAGDAAMAWSNERIHSPEHRVIISSDKARYSLGVFSHNKGTIDIPKELIGVGHPPRFKSFEHHGFLHFSAKAPGQKRDSSITAYCGFP